MPGMQWPALGLPQARLGRGREGFEGVAGPPVPRSWSRPHPPPPPRRPPSVSGTPRAPAGPAPPGPSSPPPPVDTEWARVRYPGTGAHPIPVLVLAALAGPQVIQLSPFSGTELLRDPIPLAPMLNRRQRVHLSSVLSPPRQMLSLSLKPYHNPTHSTLQSPPAPPCSNKHPRPIPSPCIQPRSGPF